MNTWSAGTLPLPTFVTVLGKVFKNHSVKPAIPMTANRNDPRQAENLGWSLRLRHATTPTHAKHDFVPG